MDYSGIYKIGADGTKITVADGGTAMYITYTPVTKATNAEGVVTYTPVT